MNVMKNEHYPMHKNQTTNFQVEILEYKSQCFTFLKLNFGTIKIMKIDFITFTLLN